MKDVKLVAIGWLGCKTVYIDVTREEAIQKYDQENPDCTVLENQLPVTEMIVNDKFHAYDIYECD